MKKLIFLICSGFILQAAYSQTNVVEFLKAGKKDANTLFKAYLDPYAMALGDGLNNGWYNSAETHKLFGFDLSITVSAIQIPERDQTFDISKLGLSKISVESGGNIAPTVAGSDTKGPRLQIKDDSGKPIASFNSPNGAGLDILPVPMVQLGFGLLPHTDVIGRYVPEIKYNNDGDDMKVGFWGIGVKHNFKEWIPVIKALPFDASLFASYSAVDAQSELSFDPNDFSDGNVTVSFGNQGQMLKVNTNTTKYGLVVSKKVGVLTVFGGIGKSKSESTVDLIGKYIISTEIPIAGTTITTKEELVDPIAIRFESNNLSLDAGLRLKLAFFSLFGSVNKAEYLSYNAGISLGMR